MSVFRLAAQIASLLVASPVLVAGSAAQASGRPVVVPPRSPSIVPGTLVATESPSAGAARSAGARAEPSARVIDWVIATRDNGASPFIVIDKGSAELFVFDASGRLLAQAPVLLGVAKGDTSMPGVGDLDLSRIPVSQRTTPAGRFEARFGAAEGHTEKVLWVDFATAIALHPLVTSNPREQRLARLQSQTPADNRITFGCINLDPELYRKVVEPLFRRDGGLVYILPETRPLNEVFAQLPADEPGALSFAQAFAEFRSEKPARPR